MSSTPCERLRGRLPAADPSELELLDGPHIVVCRDTETGDAMYSGPFPTGLEALARAQRDHDSERAAGSTTLEFSVAPLFAD